MVAEPASCDDTASEKQGNSVLPLSDLRWGLDHLTKPTWNLEAQTHPKTLVLIFLLVHIAVGNNREQI